MAEPIFLSSAPPLAGLNNQRNPHRPTANSREGIFYSTRVRYYIVTALLWSGLIAGGVCAGVGAWSFGVAIREWMAR